MMNNSPFPPSFPPQPPTQQQQQQPSFQQYGQFANSFQPPPPGSYASQPHGEPPAAFPPGAQSNQPQQPQFPSPASLYQQQMGPGTAPQQPQMTSAPSFQPPPQMGAPGVQQQPMVPQPLKPLSQFPQFTTSQPALPNAQYTLPGNGLYAQPSVQQDSPNLHAATFTNQQGPPMPPLPPSILSGGGQFASGQPQMPPSMMPPQPPQQMAGQQMPPGFPPIAPFGQQPQMPSPLGQAPFAHSSLPLMTSLFPDPRQPPHLPQPPRQRLDPNMIPSVVQVIDDDRGARAGVFPTGYPTAELPPLVTTDFVAQDQGNCNPKFVRSSLYAVPQTSEMLKLTGIPLTLAITPFAELHESENPPPVVDLGEMGPVRCQRCKAYMSPFMEFIDGGRKFRCPLCRASTPVEETYFAHLDHTGRRTDVQHRAELCLGSYEFVATKPYCKNGMKPKEPAYIFMLDVSYNAIKSGVVKLFCRHIISLLRNLQRDAGAEQSGIKIGLATYDNVVHFYNLGREGGPEMLIVNDVNDIFVPFVEGFLVGCEDAELALTRCLGEIDKNFQDSRITEVMLGPAIQAGLDALKNLDRAGKLFILHSSLPQLEAPGQLKSRDDRKLLGTDKEKTVLTPATEFYSKLGEECVKSGCGVDLFLFPNSFIDVTSLAPIVTSTGGSIYKYMFFDAEHDGERFLSDLQRDISRQTVFDVMVRVRTSAGIRPTGFFGSFLMQNTTDMELATLDSDKSIQVEIKYDDKLDPRENAYMQVAVLFTSSSGQRRLRVHNLSLPITADFPQIYRLADQDVVVTHLFKNAIYGAKEKSPKDMRDEIIVTCTRILSTYREKCSESTPPGQLILPEVMKLLPVYANCILKSDALSGGSELTVDDKAFLMSLVPSMTVSDASAFLYPRVYRIDGLSLDESGAFAHVPIQVRASLEYMPSEAAFFIENGLVAFVWVGLGVSVDWLQQVFAVNSVNDLDTESHNLPSLNNPYSEALRHLVSMVDEGRPRSVRLFIVKQQDGLESWMKKFLVEDKYAANHLSYVDFLCLLHRQIREQLSS